MPEVTAGALWELFKHARSWLANLKRAGDQRKLESKQALRGIVSAARETAVYMRQVKETGTPNHDTEMRLSMRWTELGFLLEDLGIGTLAKRCQIKGKHWSDPAHYDSAFLDKADVSLESMERLALKMLHEVDQ